MPISSMPIYRQCAWRRWPKRSRVENIAKSIRLPRHKIIMLWRRRRDVRRTAACRQHKKSSVAAARSSGTRILSQGSRLSRVTIASRQRAPFTLRQCRTTSFALGSAW
jgi:hypothetical protein